MTLDASNLQVSVEEQERWRRSMSVTVPASVVREEEQRAAQQERVQKGPRAQESDRIPLRRDTSPGSSRQADRGGLPLRIGRARPEADQRRRDSGPELRAGAGPRLLDLVRRAAARRTLALGWLRDRASGTSSERRAHRAGAHSHPRAERRLEAGGRWSAGRPRPRVHPHQEARG